MRIWQIIGVSSTLIIILALPIYTLKEIQRQPPAVVQQKVAFVGSEACGKCHKKEFVEWQGSHHAKAMAVATDETVLGDFADAVFEKNGITSRFYKKDGKFFVNTRGAKGERGDFEITHTFGWFPLQQYLILFPGGKMQCLPIAWDVQQKKWFHLYPDLELDPEEWIYWTNQGQNWNSMCADCHSTKLQKNYDPVADTYASQWAEISVGCEACHGAGSKHVAWGHLPQPARLGDNGLLVQTDGTDNRQQVENCAPCHSRRSMLGDYVHEQQDLLDTISPRLLTEGLYHADGQILDEVYVYGSFVQSKMYANNVRCSDCHNVHTMKLHREKNALCLQCHQAALYDTKEHHFHKKEGEQGEPVRAADGKILFAVGTGSECVGCHMPGKYYMVNDYRPDHSIRIPRPDLSVVLGTPNGCSRCHVDKSDEWSAKYTEKWYGSEKKYHFGATFHAARKGEPQARDELIRLVADNLSPEIVRATALSLLGRYQGEEITNTFKQALASASSLIRRAAVASLPRISPEELVHMVGPILDDPSKGVRIEAARTLTAIPAEKISHRWQEPLKTALEEYRQTALYSADFAASRLNLGVLSIYQGKMNEAEASFKKAVSIDRDFYTARNNLAILYSRQGKYDLAEEQLRKALAIDDNLVDIHYALGLLLSEQKNYTDAVAHLQKAVTGMPGNARAQYNLGQLLAFLRRDTEAEAALKNAIAAEQHNMNYLTAMTQFYLQRRRLAEAKVYAEKMTTVAPENSLGRQMLEFIHEQEQ